MAFLIGTDEAGYGPNLGPLVISATGWQVPDENEWPDLYVTLKSCVSREPLQASCASIPFADSKALYSAGETLANLELGVLAALAMLTTKPKNWQEIWPALDPASEQHVTSAAWFRDYQEKLPVHLNGERLTEGVALLSAGLRAAEVQICRVRSRVVFPEEFNELCERYENKASALSALTLELVRDAVQSSDDDRILIQCDKHGGRNKYCALLQQFFPDDWVEIVREGREESVYRWGTGKRHLEVRFVAKGESFLPSALASMTSKYLRELAMRAFNRYWCDQIPNLKPTAGYPVDAVRFKAQILTLQNQLGFSDRVLWRNR